MFLHSYGVSTSRGGEDLQDLWRIGYQHGSRQSLCPGPDIRGIGFKTADQIAQRLGIRPDSLPRACAALSHILLEATNRGHCALPAQYLREEACQLLSVDKSIVNEALARA